MHELCWRLAKMQDRSTRLTITRNLHVYSVALCVQTRHVGAVEIDGLLLYLSTRLPPTLA